MKGPPVVPVATWTVRVEVPAALGMLLELRVAVIPLTLAVSPTVPEKPLIGPTVIVDVPEEPGATVSAAGLALVEKSGALTSTASVTEWDWPPVMAVPATVTVYVPGVAEL